MKEVFFSKVVHFFANDPRPEKAKTFFDFFSIYVLVLYFSISREEAEGREVLDNCTIVSLSLL